MYAYSIMYWRRVKRLDFKMRRWEEILTILPNKIMSQKVNLPKYMVRLSCEMRQTVLVFHLTFKLLIHHPLKCMILHSHLISVARICKF